MKVGLNRQSPTQGGIRWIDIGLPAFVGEVHASTQPGVYKLTSSKSLKELFSEQQSDFRRSVEGFFRMGGRACYVLHIPNLEHTTEERLGTLILGEDRGAGDRTGLHSLSDLNDLFCVCMPGKTSHRAWEAVLVYLARRPSLCGIVEGPFPEPTEDFLTRLKDVSSTTVVSEGRVSLKDRLTWLEFMPKSQSSRLGLSQVAQIGLSSPTDSSSNKAPPSGPALGLFLSQGDRNKKTHSSVQRSIAQWLSSENAHRTRSGLPTLGETFTSLNGWRRWEELRRSIELGTRWVLFEIQDAFLAPRVEREINGFLHRCLDQGHLEPLSRREPFRVSCRAQVREDFRGRQGRLVVEIEAKIPDSQGEALSGMWNFASENEQ